MIFKNWLRTNFNAGDPLRKLVSARETRIVHKFINELHGRDGVRVVKTRDGSMPYITYDPNGYAAGNWHPFKCTLNDAATEITIGEGYITAGQQRSTSLRGGRALWPYTYLRWDGGAYVQEAFPASVNVQSYALASDGEYELGIGFSVDKARGEFTTSYKPYRSSTLVDSIFRPILGYESTGSSSNHYVLIAEVTVASGKVTSLRQRWKDDIYAPVHYHTNTTVGYYCGLYGGQTT
jgi:hypothetical protein